MIAFAVACLIAVSCGPRTPGTPRDPGEAEGFDIRGTWRALEMDGKTVPLDKYSVIKMYTAKHFVWMLSDNAGNIIGAAGGTYTIEGNTLRETFDKTIGMRNDEMPLAVTSRLFEEAGRLRVDTDADDNDEIWERMD